MVGVAFICCTFVAKIKCHARNIGLKNDMYMHLRHCPHPLKPLCQHFYCISSIYITKFIYIMNCQFNLVVILKVNTCFCIYTQNSCPQTSFSEKKCMRNILLNLFGLTYCRYTPSLSDFLSFSSCLSRGSYSLLH